MWRRMWPLADTNFLSQVLSFGEALSLPKAMRGLIALRTPKALASPALPATAGRQCEILFRASEARLLQSAGSPHSESQAISFTLGPASEPGGRPAADLRTCPV